MKIRIMTLLASAALAMPAAVVAAEVPQRGMSEARVRADFGSPSSVRGPVGSPAITRWNYDGFSVYFENGITLHTVVDRPASTAPDVVSGTVCCSCSVSVALRNCLLLRKLQPIPNRNNKQRRKAQRHPCSTQ